MRNIKVEFNKKLLFQGIVLVAIGILLPSIITEEDFGIYLTAIKALKINDSGMLLKSAAKLVILNSMRAIPHYLGALIISESLTITHKDNKKYFIKGMLSFVIVLLVYHFIYKIYGIKYDFGFPSIIVIICITYLEKQNLFSVNLIKKILFISLFLLGVQWLDIIPNLSILGFGRGEISRDIKNIAILLDYGELINFFSITFFLIFIFNAIILMKLANEEHKLKLATLKKEKVEQSLMKTRMKALELRTFSEIQNLVHDLKTPLTTIQGLSSLCELMEENEEIKEYQKRISSSVDKMSIMITEILNEDSKIITTTEKLFKLVLSNISVNDFFTKIEYNNNCPDKKVLINKIRISRAIINTIENSYNAIIQEEHGIIKIIVDCADESIIIKIIDNGIGIKKQELEKVWFPGYSLNNSTGLGLGFTKKVIENHGGTIDIKSVENYYTCVTIELAKVD